jgi:hypothetical protein
MADQYHRRRRGAEAVIGFGYEVAQNSEPRLFVATGVFLFRLLTANGTQLQMHG